MDIKTATKIAKDVNSTAEKLASLIGFNKKVDCLLAKHPKATTEMLETLSRMEILAGPDIPMSLVEWALKYGSPKEILMVYEHPAIPIEVFFDPAIDDHDDDFYRIRERATMAKFCMALGLDTKISSANSKYFDHTYYLGHILIRPRGRKSYVDIDRLSPWDDKIFGQFQLKKLWDKLVPKYGDAETIQGQFGCIYYRFTNEYWRNGLMNWVHQIGDDDFYYRGLVEFLEDRLVAEKPFGHEATRILADMLKQLFHQHYPAQINLFHASSFETIMEYLLWAFYAYNIKHPELIPNDEDEKCDIANKEDAGTDVLEKLALNISSRVRCAVANNPNCPVDLLRKLSSDRSVQVRLAVARRNDCPVDCLETLSGDDDVNVRNAAARNSQFPESKRQAFIDAQLALMLPKGEAVGKSLECNWSLMELSAQLSPEFFLEKLTAYLSQRIDKRDGTINILWCCRHVLYYILWNENAPKLGKELKEKYPGIDDWDDFDEIEAFRKIARNFDTTAEELAKLVGIDKKIDRLVAKHPNATAEMLEILSRSADKLTQKNVARNKRVENTID